jgi:nucleoside-diphosphate-sugar epimerase
MKILLTGGNGFLGSYILKCLKEYYEVHTLSRNNSYYNCNLKLEIPKLINSYDLIIHSAGKAHSTPLNEEEKSDFYRINVNGTINLLIGLTKINLPKQFIFISSVSVYGLNDGQFINESAPLLAIDPYGKSKIEAEDIITKWCLEHNVICTILRLPLVVGNNPPGNLGSMIRGINKGYYFNIGGGIAKKSMVLATDVARFILKASEVGGIYNLTDGKHPSFIELSRNISLQIGKSYINNLPLFIAKVLAKIGDIIGNTFPINSYKLSKITSTLTFDDSKARKAFGWNPTSVLDGFKSNEHAR